MNEVRFEIETSDVVDGLCDFGVRLGDGSWHCQASYIGDFPLKPLLVSAVELNSFIHQDEDDRVIEDPVWDSRTADEPGGIVIRARPAGDDVAVTIYYYEGEPLWPDPKKCPDVAPVAEAVITFREYAEAIYRDAVKVLVKHGVTGIHHHWSLGRWDKGEVSDVFPVPHLLRLAAILKGRVENTPLSWPEELAILREITSEAPGG